MIVENRRSEKTVMSSLVWTRPVRRPQLQSQSGPRTQIDLLSCFVVDLWSDALQAVFFQVYEQVFRVQMCKAGDHKVAMTALEHRTSEDERSSLPSSRWSSAKFVMASVAGSRMEEP